MRVVLTLLIFDQVILYPEFSYNLGPQNYSLWNFTVFVEVEYLTFQHSLTEIKVDRMKD